MLITVFRTKLSIEKSLFSFFSTIWPSSSDPFYIVTYYIKGATPSWTHSTFPCRTEKEDLMHAAETLPLKSRMSLEKEI